MTVKTVYPHELIGKVIEVVESTNKENLGLMGRVVDETKSTLKIEQQGEIKTLLKSNIVIKISKTGLFIDGKTITKRPEDRVKCGKIA
tara:strand:+ start:118 stop:381 length:264 start_codon:yes stop_codon:yes gene_type:complete